MNRFSFRWENFRSFEDTSWVEAKPLTILIGPNNSGKTSLILPLLIMKQTLDSLDFDLPLLTRGEFASIGWFEDFIFIHDVSRLLSFHIRFHEHERKERGELKKIGSYPPGTISLQFAERTTKNEIDLTSFSVQDIFHRTGYLDRVLQKDEKKYSFDFCAKIPKKTRPEGKIWNAILDHKPRHFLFPSSPIFRTTLPAPSEKPPKSIRISEAAGLYMAVCELVSSQVRRLMGNISYIGPIREPFKRFYEISAERPSSVGIKGANTPQILLQQQKNTDFMKDVSKWLKAFELGQKISFPPSHPGTFRIELRKSKKDPRVNFADTGFGFSQVLPLVVQGLYAPTRSLIIAEQPEIHLNPRLQCVLADLFVEIAKSGKGVMVETHSEHFLLRLRRLVAEREFDPKDVALYFVEKEGVNSSVRQVPIEENGHISDESWPKGFFEDSLRESLGLAAMQSRRKKKEL
jgi:hypothetical protein